MKRYVITAITLIGLFCSSNAQERTVENRPYTDLRPFHFGVLVGTHLQDLELLNAGPQVITNDDGTTANTVVTVDQNRWDIGFHVGVLGELRLNTYFQLRVAPAMYFGTRHLTFHDFTDLHSDGTPKETNQELKSAYISTAVDMIFAAPRFNNHRPYLVAGINPMINLSGKNSDYIKLKRTGLSLEIGAGCDFYLPFFKLRPELKFVYGLGNNLDTEHYKQVRDKNLLRYTNAAKEAHSKMFVLTFYFE